MQLRFTYWQYNLQINLIETWVIGQHIFETTREHNGNQFFEVTYVHPSWQHLNAIFLLFINLKIPESSSSKDTMLKIRSSFSTISVHKTLTFNEVWSHVCKSKTIRQIYGPDVYDYYYHNKQLPCGHKIHSLGIKFAHIWTTDITTKGKYMICLQSKFPGDKHCHDVYY
mgnify:CR=1 FL=1